MDYLTIDDLRSVLAEALAPLATREEMRALREEMRTFATREEVFAAFPTRDQMHEAIREAGEETRRHFDVVAEALRADIRLLAEGLAALDRR